MSERRLVLVAGVGDLADGDPAFRAALELARGTAAELHLVRVYELPRALDVAPELGTLGPADTYSDPVLGELQAIAARTPGADGAVCHVMQGTPGGGLLRVAKEVGADLLVVGAARGPRLARMVLGTTAQRVLRESRVPVLVVRRGVARPLGRLLLTGDLSDQSAAVHEAALPVVARLFGPPAQVRSLCVLPWSVLPPPPPGSGLRDAAARHLDEFLAAREDQGCRLEPRVRVGSPADEIVAEATEWSADLLVVGTHARGWGARLLLGSVAEATLRDAPCNVLAVPPRLAAIRAPRLAPTVVESEDLARWAEAVGA